MNISTVRAGVLVFYITSGAGAFLGGRAGEAAEQAVLLWMGRGMGALIGFGLVLTGLSELSREDINGELRGRPGEPLWAAVNRLLAWASPPAAGWHFYRGDIWDGLMMLCYPAWLVLLRLESRRRDIEEGSRRVLLPWRLLVYFSLASCALFFSLTMVLPYGGPAFLWDGEAYRLYPLLAMLSIPAIIIGAIGCGGKL